MSQPKQKSKQRPLWEKIIQPPFATGIIVVLFLIAFTFAAYKFGWDWTGLTSVTGPQLHPNEQYRPAKTLWDVLQLLIIPFVLAIGGFWLNRIQKDREEQQEKWTEQKLLLRKLDSNIIQAYNSAKRVRRLLRATARCLSPDQKETMIMIEPYDKQMQALIDIQLQFETFKEEVKSNQKLFSGKADTLENNLGCIEVYLNNIVAEYENNYKMRIYNNTPTLPKSIESNKSLSEPSLSKLKEFIGPYKHATDFKNEFKKPAGEVMRDLRNLLTSEESNQAKRVFDQVST